MANVAEFVNREVVGLTVAVCYLLKLAREKNLVTEREVDAALAAAADTAGLGSRDPDDTRAMLQPINTLRQINATGDWKNIAWFLPS
jgi:hypothetical protein